MSNTKTIFMKYFLSAICLCFFFNIAIKAQDKIYKKNGNVITCRVTEVGVSEVKYMLPKDSIGIAVVYVLDKETLIKIVFADGREETFVSDYKNSEQYIGQLTKAIKIDFMGPLIGYSQFGFEKSTGIGTSYEATLAIIGLGKGNSIEYYDANNSWVSKRRAPFGVALSFGYKFNKLPNFLFGKSRYSHLMQGSYAKPILYLGNYSENIVVYKSTTSIAERKNTTFAALQIEFGKQWVFGEKFLFDAYWGLGYGIDNKHKNGDYYNDNETSAYNYLNSRLGKSPGVSLSFGIKTGILIK